MSQNMTAAVTAGHLQVDIPIYVGPSIVSNIQQAFKPIVSKRQVAGESCIIVCHHMIYSGEDDQSPSPQQVDPKWLRLISKEAHLFLHTAWARSERASPGRNRDRRDRRWSGNAATRRGNLPDKSHLLPEAREHQEGGDVFLRR